MKPEVSWIRGARGGVPPRTVKIDMVRRHALAFSVIALLEEHQADFPRRRNHSIITHAKPGLCLECMAVKISFYYLLDFNIYDFGTSRPLTHIRYYSARMMCFFSSSRARGGSTPISNLWSCEEILRR